VLFLYLQYGIYDSPHPSTFFRSAPAITEDTKNRPLLSPRDNSPYRMKDSLTVILTSEIGHGATGVVLRGMLNADGSDGSTPLDVVVKLAFDSEQRAALRDEYAVYRFLRSKGVVKGIATALGFFDDCQRGPSALVMRYAGVSLGIEPGRVLTLFERWVFDTKCSHQRRKLIFIGKHSEAALTTLHAIHDAGILHGDIRPANILVSSYVITIIDFGHSFRSNDKMAKKKEHKLLCYLLR
jgi:serine/threonine protein kinase